MLTASQCEIVAFVTDGGIICRDCATARYGEMGVAAIEEGLAEFLPRDVSPLIRYELDTYIGELASEHASEYCDEHGVEPGEYDRVWDREYDNYLTEYPCDGCGEGCV